MEFTDPPDQDGPFRPGRRVSVATMVTLLAYVHDVSLPDSPGIFVPPIANPVEVFGSQDRSRMAMWRACSSFMMSNDIAPSRAATLEGYLSRVRLWLEEDARQGGGAAQVGGKPAADLGEQVAKSSKEYDAFLCHASEDKDALVRPFADLMGEHGLRPWLDEREINWGHNLAKKIQEGLARSRFVVVFLSSAFLSKKGWTDKELSAALSMDDLENPLVLPVVLGITHEELEAKYPLVSAKKYHRIPDYDPAKQVPPGELNRLVEELKNMIGVSDRRTGRGRP